MEQFKGTHDQQATAAEEQRDRANPTTLMELVLRRLAEISERNAAKDAGTHGAAEDLGADKER